VDEVEEAVWVVVVEEAEEQYLLLDTVDEIGWKRVGDTGMGLD